MPRRKLGDLPEENLKARHATLSSVVMSLYVEASKISARKPELVASDLMVTSTNDAIIGVKELVAADGDEFAARITEFLPAGDPPEIRDVVLVLAALDAALKRMNQRHEFWLFG